MKFPLPHDALSGHIAVVGKTGSGKTYTAKGIVERILEEKRQVCVLDPTGAWWGLRLSADGKSKGYEIILLGGKHGDIPLSPRSGAAVARLVTEQHASVVLDTSGMSVGEYTWWFIDFAGTLYTTIREPLHLIIDEAHYFMPQARTLDVQGGKMLHAGNRLMSGGRSLGIAMYAIGYNNANCIGCVKGGAGYWNKIRRDFPERFEEMAQIEDMIGPSAFLMRDRKSGVRISLRQLDPETGRHDATVPDCGFACARIEDEMETAREAVGT